MEEVKKKKNENQNAIKKKKTNFAAFKHDIP